MLGKGDGSIRNRRKRRDHPNYSIVEISQNTINNLGDMRLAVTKAPVKDHLLTLV